MTTDQSDHAQDVNNSLNGDFKLKSRTLESKQSKLSSPNLTHSQSHHVLSDTDLILNDKVEVRVLLNALFDLMNV